MKKLCIILCGLLVCIGIAVQPASSQGKRKQKPKAKRAAVVKPRTGARSAVEVKLGLSMMYDWWRPAVLKLGNGLTGNIFSQKYKSDTDGSFMMGPAIGIRIGTDWNIEMSALLGCSRNQFRHSTLAMEASYLNLIVPYSMFNPYLDRGIMEIRRYDADLNVEHTMFKYLNILFGARFSYHDAEGHSWRASLLYSPVSKTVDDFTNWYVGPSVGVGFIYEVKGFSFKGGVSALFQFGIYEFERFHYNPFFYNFNFISDEFKIAHLSIGADCNLRLGYFIRRIRLELWVGGRYIILPHISLYDIDSAFNAAYTKGWLTGEYEQLIGLMFGASYRF